MKKEYKRKANVKSDILCRNEKNKDFWEKIGYGFGTEMEYCDNDGNLARWKHRKRWN